jgi:hypothetical protein
MTTLRFIISIVILTIFCCCGNSSVNKTATNNNVFKDTAKTSISSRSISDLDALGDTIADIKFNEFSVSINRLIIYDEDHKIDQIQKDTVEIYADIGETIEGQLFSISSEHLSNFSVEQRYETSITIMDEGPHCDLINWKHYDSDWIPLKQNTNEQFVGYKYSASDFKKFPDISINEMKQKVKEQCGEEWFKLIEKVKTLTEYPSGVGISRFYIKITGQRKDNGKMVSKLIIIHTPMGC